MPFPFIPFAYAFTFPFGAPPISSTLNARGSFVTGLPGAGSDLVKVNGTRSWLLVNLDGNVDMRPNEMDVIFFNGAIRQIPPSSLVLDQRIRKSVAEVQGQNRFAPGWGSVITQYIGAKIIDTSTLRDIGQSVADMFEELIQLQSVTKRRLNLQPFELIDSVSRLKVTAEGTVITVTVTVITQAKTVEEILIPAAVDVVQAGGPGGTPAFT